MLSLSLSSQHHNGRRANGFLPRAPDPEEEILTSKHLTVDKEEEKYFELLAPCFQLVHTISCIYKPASIPRPCIQNSFLHSSVSRGNNPLPPFLSPTQSYMTTLKRSRFKYPLAQRAAIPQRSYSTTRLFALILEQDSRVSPFRSLPSKSSVAAHDICKPLPSPSLLQVAPHLSKCYRVAWPFFFFVPTPDSAVQDPAVPAETQFRASAN